jgi:hypothetical protein
MLVFHTYLLDNGILLPPLSDELHLQSCYITSCPIINVLDIQSQEGEWQDLAPYCHRMSQFTNRNIRPH